eukprot:1250141-Lingulodinium_polyedra.AAC.1
MPGRRVPRLRRSSQSRWSARSRRPWAAAAPGRRPAASSSWPTCCWWCSITCTGGRRATAGLAVAR